MSASLHRSIDRLTQDPLRNIVLLKQLLAYPEHVAVRQATGPEGVATLVALDISASSYDRHAYPKAAIAAFIVSDHPELTAALLSHLPRGVGIVFKLADAADLAPIEAQFALERRTAFISFTSSGDNRPDPHVRTTSAPGEDAFDLFAEQEHDRAWLTPLLRDGRAFACVLDPDGRTRSACFAFANHGTIWEVGGVVTAATHRRAGFGARVVRTALAELSRRGLVPRYQVEESNEASIGLARSVGLAPFLTITHYAHAC